MRYPYVSTDPLPPIMDISSVAAYLRVDGDAEVLDLLLKAAMHAAEKVCNQPLFFRTFTVSLAGFNTSGRLSGVTPTVAAVKYDLEGDADLDLTSTGYTLDRGLFRFVQEVTQSMTPLAVRLTYTAGYTRENLPEDISIALLLLCAQLYDNRSNTVQEKRTVVDNLLQPYKIESV